VGVDFVVATGVDGVVCVATGADVVVWVATGAEASDLPRGAKTMSSTTTMIASSASPTTSRRRQYTLLDCGPTGCFRLDMPSG